MKLFLSWSTTSSRQLAELLKAWLPDVIQAVEPWMSSKDIAKGALWGNQLFTSLSDTSQGIICVTPGVGQQPWLTFEAGALFKSVENARVRPLLYQVTAAELVGPLSLFQITHATEKEDMRQLIRSVNGDCERPLAPDVLDRHFDRLWPEFLAGLSVIPVDPAAAPQPAQPDALTEILELVRDLQRSFATAPAARAPLPPVPRDRSSGQIMSTVAGESSSGQQSDLDVQRQLIAAELEMARKYETLGDLALRQGDLAESDESMEKASQLYSRARQRVDQLSRALELDLRRPPLDD